MDRDVDMLTQDEWDGLPDLCVFCYEELELGTCDLVTRGHCQKCCRNDCKDPEGFSWESL